MNNRKLWHDPVEVWVKRNDGGEFLPPNSLERDSLLLIAGSVFGDRVDYDIALLSKLYCHTIVNNKVWHVKFKFVFSDGMELLLITNEWSVPNNKEAA